MENWKDIKGYEGLYQVSDMGRVKSSDRIVKNHLYKGKILNGEKFGNGYIRIDLCKDGKRKVCLLHRLVAEAFVPNPDNLPEVNHNDENIENCVASNLSWMSSKGNANWGTRNQRQALKISKPIQELTLNGDMLTVWNSASDAAKHYGFNKSNICACCAGRLLTYKGRKWAYHN